VRSTSSVYLVFAAPLALVCGCATNSLRLDRASTVSSAGEEAVTRTRSFVQTVSRARDDANIALIASDVSCAWGKTVVLRGDLRPLPSGKTTPPLCLAPGTVADTALGDVTLDLRPVPTNALRPTLTGISALAAYLEAINAIVEAPPSGIADTIADAYAKARTAQSDLAAITGGQIELVRKLTADQTKAITGLITLVEELATEQRKVGQLRALVQKQNASVSTVIASLKSSVEVWTRSSLVGDVQLSDAAFISLGRKLAADPPVYGTFETRRAVLEQIVGARRTAGATVALQTSISGALDEMQAAQNELVDGLSNHPNWSDAERQKAAQINRTRLLGALHAIAAVATAF
jgi:hypothetical protein